MSSVKIWEQKISIPTYGTGKPDKNPMFLEKRVYQGSSGRVYPYPVIDKIEDEKHYKEYIIVFLENEYIQVQVMPEIGGRIYCALDKTNNYDFVYRNRVIKPALVGLTGPWISGGIEFNWPQHHRPNTFGPVDYRIDDSEPDIKTVWLTERDRMYGTKVTTGITVRKDSARIEIHSELYNPTGEYQTFLWWANPAVAVHDETQSIFPPDVHAVMDHGKRDVSRFPIATGVYYKYDYSAGVDISRYKNIPVPTSYMAYHSDYDFVGGYDYRAQAGILHIADHHISPGKKQWTWGNGEFGQAWDRSLTDEDGPYIELMTGVFTDNQPDFTWLAPYEGKNFTQYFMPYKTVGEVKNANKDIVLGLNINDGKALVSVYASRPLEQVQIVLKGKTTYLHTTKNLDPRTAFQAEVDVAELPEEITLSVSSEGLAALSYTPAKQKVLQTPEPAAAIGKPETLPNNEALWLAGVHLEQYRHATYEPDLYYKEGIKRDPSDLRINNAYGNLLLRRGDFDGALECFMRAEKTATRHSPNPFDGEVYFNLGKAYQWLGNKNKAYDAYYKATWNDNWKSQCFLKLGLLDAKYGDYDKALEHLYQSLYSGYKNMKTRGAITVLLRLTGKNDDAHRFIAETLSFDPMDSTALYEQGKLNGQIPAALAPHAAITLAQFYRELGLWQEAADILQIAIRSSASPYAMLRYYLADCHSAMGDNSFWKKAAEENHAYCFPSSLEDYAVLLNAVKHNPADAKAMYYIGCFLYDKKRHSDAKNYWEKSAELQKAFPTVHRNLALYYANKEKNYSKAQELLEKAFSIDESDARILYELCELYVKIGISPNEQKAVMEKHKKLTLSRDDLVVLYGQALNTLGAHKEVIDLLTSRKFHPWEGGEGKVPTLHIEARIGLAKKMIEQTAYSEAVDHLKKALVYDVDFGEGKLTGAQENNIYYYMGLALKSLDEAAAVRCFETAAQGLSEPTSAMYYNDQPPHMIFYQGLALHELGSENEARKRFNKLIAYGEKHIFQPQTMDYFAVSLPDFLVFETDLDEKNKIHCYYMMALGYSGLGEKEKALENFDLGLALSPNHYGLLIHRALLLK